MTVQDNKSFLPAFTQQASHLFAPLQREIDRVFNDFGRGLSISAPDLDFSETAAGVELKLDVPGYAESEISINLDGDVLTVAGEKTSETEDKGRTYRIIERRSGAFARSVTLPRGVDGEQIKAALKDGVLTITAPKTAAPSGKTIAIETANPAHA